MIYDKILNLLRVFNRFKKNFLLVYYDENKFVKLKFNFLTIKDNNKYIFNIV
jgi:hypothetical protein